MLEDVATMQKYPTPAEIGRFVQGMRTHLGIKQETLATDARVDVRTIARIEAGQKVANATLGQVAVALRLPADFFEKGLPALATAMDEAAREEIARDNILVPVTPAASGHTMVERLLGADCFFSRMPEELSEDQRDAVSALIGTASDWNDILSDLPFQTRNEAGANLTDLLKEVTELGLITYVGSSGTKLVWPETGSDPAAKNREPLPWRIGVICIVPKDELIEIVAVPKRGLRI